MIPIAVLFVGARRDGYGYRGIPYARPLYRRMADEHATIDRVRQGEIDAGLAANARNRAGHARVRQKLADEAAGRAEALRVHEELNKEAHHSAQQMTEDEVRERLAQDAASRAEALRVHEELNKEAHPSAHKS